MTRRSPDAEPEIVIVAAAAKNSVIGADNRLLWRLKSDLRRFRALTLGKPVIMGRKTFESIGKPLPGRRIIVVTRDRAWSHEDVVVTHSPADALERGSAIAAETGTGEVMIAGGGEIYRAFLPRADRLEMTAVMLEPAGDASFPAIDPLLWREASRQEFGKSIDDEAAFAFISYVRR